MTEKESKKVVIKRTLGSILANDAALRACVMPAIEDYVEEISRAYRRASILLHLAFAIMRENGTELPDLYSYELTDWKHLLSGNKSGRAGDEILRHVEAYEHLVEQPLYRTPLDAQKSKVHVHDQVLANASTTFETAVINNAWCPLITRLSKLTTIVRASNDGTPSLKAYKLLAGVRARDAVADIDEWPEWALEFRKEVRSRLGLGADDWLFDAWAKPSKRVGALTYSIVYNFNAWMHDYLKALNPNKRGWMLSPVFKVQRASIHLDVKPLTDIAVRACNAVYGVNLKMTGKKAEGVEIARSIFKPSIFKKHGPRRVKFDCGIHTDGYGASVIYSKGGHQEKNGIKAKIAKAMAAKEARDANPPPPKKKKPVCKVLKEGIREVKDYPRDLSTLISTDEDAASTSAPPKPPKIVLGADPGRNPNIVTVGFCADPRADPKRLSTSFRKHKRSWTLSRASYYSWSGIRKEDDLQKDRYAPLRAAMSQLGGGGAGALVEAAAAVVEPDGVPIAENVEMEEIEGGVEDNGANGGAVEQLVEDSSYNDAIAVGIPEAVRPSALRTSSSDAIIHYLELYSEFKEQWWSVALNRRESRASFQRYVGKRRVLDRFFADVVGDTMKLFPGCDQEIAYGHAHKSMKAGGRMELSVPVSKTYQSCVRAFRKRDPDGDGPDLSSCVVNEMWTTAVDFETGTRSSKVFMKGSKVQFVIGVGPKGERSPPVTEDDTGRVQLLCARLKKERAKRRGCRRPGSSGWVGDGVGEDDAGAHQNTVRYPVVRGLRFVSETRKFLDRDLSAARTIARLRVLELTRFVRPAVYTHGPADLPE